MLREPLKERAIGKWRAILPALGVPVKALSNRHGPCPMCGGKDRWRFDDKGGRGTWICSQCGAGDGIELVKRLQRVDFKEAAQLIERHISDAPVMSFRGEQKTDDARQREEMAAMWKRGRVITPDDLAGRYLHERVGLTEFPPCLRFSPDERYSEPGARSTWHPVMLAKVDPSDQAATEGQRAALHRTYLDKFGAGKADVSSPRKMMGAMPSGAAVRLAPAAETMGIAEGIETALAAAKLFNIPVWAALTAGLLQDWTPPAIATTVFIFGDNDESSTGQAAAYTLAQRLKAKRISVVVEIPPRVGTDWADVLKAKGAQS